MKVLMNVDSLIPPLTGIGCYTQQLVAGLLEREAECQLACFLQSRIVDPSSPLLTGSISNTLDRKFEKIRRIVRRIPGAYQLRSKMTNIMFKRAVRRHVCDGIYHEPNYILKPFDGVSITTIHDLSFYHYPQFHPRERIRYMEREFSKTLDRAKHIITDCQYVKNELNSILGISTDRISVVPLGVGSQYCPRSEPEVHAVMRKYHLNYGQYLLAVATLEPRKNLQGLITAYMRLPTRVRRLFPLVLVGGHGWQCSELKTQISQLETAGELCYLGYLPLSELLLIYSGAGGFAFPSHYEGFGLPPLEAMASGVPVLAAENSAMAEVVSDAGILVNSEDTDAIHDGLKKLLLDDSFRVKARQNGLLQASKFTWKSCVDQTLAVYRKVRE